MGGSSVRATWAAGLSTVTGSNWSICAAGELARFAGQCGVVQVVKIRLGVRRTFQRGRRSGVDGE